MQYPGSTGLGSLRRRRDTLQLKVVAYFHARLDEALAVVDAYSLVAEGHVCGYHHLHLGAGLGQFCSWYTGAHTVWRTCVEEGCCTSKSNGCMIAERKQAKMRRGMRAAWSGKFTYIHWRKPNYVCIYRPFTVGILQQSLLGRYCSVI